jgi:choline kinase
VARARAVILAAGRGARMGGARPKALIPVAEDRPLLHYLLRGLRVAGVTDLMVVTGFASAAVQSFVSDAWEGAAPTYVFNARYASWGNFHSVRVALDQSPGHDVLVVNSDIVVHPEVFRRVLGAFADLVLAVEPRAGLDREDMRVALEGDRVRAVSKSLGPSEGHGEFCGVSLIRPPAARRYLDVATTREWRAETAGYYEDVYDAILPQVDARAALVERDEYAEVDRPEDVETAATVIARHSGIWAVPSEAAS